MISSLDLLSFYDEEGSGYRNVDASRGMSGMGKEKPREKSQKVRRDREGRRVKTTGGSRRKENESKRHDGKIAASEENRHLHSALHLLFGVRE